MIIKSTHNTVATAMIFSVLSGVSTLGTAKLQDVDLNSVRVSFADLNVTREQGQHTLYERLKDAAKTVCGDVPIKTASDVHVRRQCYEEALDNAVDQVGNEGLAAIHRG